MIGDSRYTLACCLGRGGGLTLQRAVLQLDVTRPLNMYTKPTHVFPVCTNIAVNCARRLLTKAKYVLIYQL